jgi:ribosome-binding ATPase YchF (GTP1/OBG family)
LQLKDLDTVEKRLEKVNKTGNKSANRKSTLDRIRETLLQAKSARIIIPQGPDEALMESFQLITTKPVLCM